MKTEKTCYLVDGYGGWFIVATQTKKDAFSEGVKEFGRGQVKSVSKATQEDIKYFKAIKGQDAINA